MIRGVGTRDANVSAPRKRAAQALKGFAAHDDRMTSGECLETFEVSREFPWQRVVDANNSVGS